MQSKLDKVKSFQRIETDVKIGLSSTQVEERVNAGAINKTKLVVGKTYSQIIFNNVFSLFNIVLFVIAGLIIYSGYYKGLFFLFVLIPNIIIGLYEDINARRLMNKMHLLNAPKANVVRNSTLINIQASELVVDDIISLKSGDSISADSIVLDGNIGINESSLTGESTVIYKHKGDLLYSGSFIVSGTGYARVEKVGKDSYIEGIQAQASKFKRSKSEILSSLRKLFRGIDIIVVLMAVAMFSIYAVQGRFETSSSFKGEVPYIAGSLVSMIPSGLYLLTSVALAVAVIALAKRKAHVQDFYSVEMLARTNILCVDKTGTITDGTMEIKDVISLTSTDVKEIKSLAYTIVAETGDDNFTAKAIKELKAVQKIRKTQVILPFNSENKYSAISYSNESYVLGALEFLNVKDKSKLNKKYNELLNKGLRVLVVGRSDSIIKNNKLIGEIDALGFIVLQDHIKEDAVETFKWFKDNNVLIKVISGDNAISVSEIAKQAGIDNSDKYISLEGMELSEVKKIANQYTVFGRVSPEQKKAIIEGLQDEGNTVGMTGDGVNDILALKTADCSIAMASGSEAARNVSHIVLMESSFNSLPNVVGEGRRVVNNLQRTCSIFLVKTFFAIVMSLTFLLGSLITKNKELQYPFSTTNMYLWELIGIGMSSFFLALEKNNELLKGKFLSNIMKRAIPAGLTITISVLLIFGLYLLQKNSIAYIGVLTYESAVTMSILTYTILSLVVLFKVCWPFSKYRGIVFGVACLVDIVCLLVCGFKSYSDGYKKTLLEINFPSLTNLNYVQTVIIIVGFSALYLFVTYIINVITMREFKEEEDEN